MTPETIRRDLTVLERRGVLRRVHGGAIPVERLGAELAVPERQDVAGPEKDRIARAALAELPDGGTLLLDAGTTTARLAELLPTDRELVVVTHALPIAQVVAQAMATRPNLTLHVVGGTVRGRTLAAVGVWAERPSPRCSRTSASSGRTPSPSSTGSHPRPRRGRRQALPHLLRPAHRRAGRPHQVRPGRLRPRRRPGGCRHRDHRFRDRPRDPRGRRGRSPRVVRA